MRYVNQRCTYHRLRGGNDDQQSQWKNGDFDLL